MNHSIKLLLLLIFLFTGSVISYPQKLISLSTLNAGIETRKFYISEIIDARSEKEILGIVRKGGKQETARLKRGFDQDIKNALKIFLKQETTLIPLIMRVLKLAVYERRSTYEETANAELIVEFYMSTSKGLVLVKDAGSTAIHSGLDVTKFHNDNIERCLMDCLNQVNDQLNVGLPMADSSMVYSYNSLLRVPEILDKNEFPVLRDTTLNKGIYKNFIEFRENAPSIGTDTRKVAMHNEASLTENIWGYSDGESIFIKLGNNFFGLTNEEDVFWFRGWEVTEIKAKLTGEAFVIAAFTGFLMMDIKEETKQIRYCINLGNGDLFPLD